ncbi:hypothetical protein GCM10017044_03200 [Kordiimonas sediminis]|uniref:Uncharacterized protein n=1 Tax=Kordiimonas sediminis TaxID=1735581 RepID=A0A919AM75_9PROT|nr:hypothetical protein GCM10017044_03200 [Kordiimonas sediminis]
MRGSKVKARSPVRHIIVATRYHLYAQCRDIGARKRRTGSEEYVKIVEGRDSLTFSRDCSLLPSTLNLTKEYKLLKATGTSSKVI